MGRVVFAMIGSVRVEEVSYEEILRYRRWYDAEKLPLAHGYFDRMADFVYDRRHYYAAYLDGRVVGFSALSLHRRQADGRAAIYQRSSCTHRDYRRRGVWNAIWAHKIDQIGRRAWARPNTLIWVRTRPGDRRYQRRGFKLEGEIARAFRGEVEPFLVWSTSWAQLLSHPATASDLVRDVRIHAPEPLQVRL